jgi:hypothetical protein
VRFATGALLPIEPLAVNVVHVVRTVHAIGAIDQWALRRPRSGARSPVPWQTGVDDDQ